MIGTRHISLLALTVVALGGCKTVRDFIIPPPQVGSARVLHQRGTKWAELVLRNVRCADPNIDTVAIRGGQIVAAGDFASVSRVIGPGTRLRDVSMGWLTPGLVDSHVHLDGAAMLRDALDLRDVKDSTELAGRITAARDVREDEAWMWAFGANHKLMSALSASRLQELAPGLQLWVSAIDGHSAVLSQALIAALPKAAVPLLDGTTGKLKGEASRAVWRLMPAPSRARLTPRILQVLQDHREAGYTGVHTMGAPLGFLRALLALDRKGRLAARVLVYLDAEALGVHRYVQQRAARVARSLRPKGKRGPAIALPDDGARHVAVVGIKVWLDGTLGSHTAALSSDYADAAGRGRLLYDDDSLLALLAQADAAQLQLSAHALGDAAVDQIARVLAAARRPADALPVRVEHAQVVSPAGLAALRGKSIVCAIQPLHELDDAPFARERLGDQRIDWAYRGASLAAVCPLASGSDMPVSAAKPFAMWHHLVTRGRDALSANDAFATLAVNPLTAKPIRLAAGVPADLVLWATQPRHDAPAPDRLMMLVDGEAVHMDPSLPRAKAAPTMMR